LDIKKAFDSISHSYLKAALQFFNFGEKFIVNILTLCTGRKASIILDDGTLGLQFNLERGNAQGDTISPYLFNIGYQILLLRINFDLQIQGFLEVPERFQTRGEPNQDQEISVPAVVSRKTRKIFAFADDCNALLLLTKANLERVKRGLSDFSQISGLECNIDKSFLMPIGNTYGAEGEVAGTGFVLTRKLTILGMKIENDCENWDENEKTISEKVKKEINFWKRFNLSLPGRINIAKTMLYSQLNYLGCFLPLSSPFQEGIEKLIGGFVVGNLKMSQGRIFESTKMGGLGLFRVSTFLTAQKCSWFKRAMTMDELWKLDFFSPAPGDYFSIRKDMFFPDPILHSVAVSFNEFLTNFTKKGNFKKSFIIDNEAFTLGVRKKQILTLESFGGHAENNPVKKKIYGLTLKDLVQGQDIKSVQEI
jgi:hypothetical protein